MAGVGGLADVRVLAHFEFDLRAGRYAVEDGNRDSHFAHTHVRHPQDQCSRRADTQSSDF